MNHATLIDAYSARAFAAAGALVYHRAALAAAEAAGLKATATVHRASIKRAEETIIEAGIVIVPELVLKAAVDYRTANDSSKAAMLDPFNPRRVAISRAESHPIAYFSPLTH